MLILSYHYLVICQWKNHYILCFVALNKFAGRFSEQNLGQSLLTNRTRKVGPFRRVISAVLYTVPRWDPLYYILPYNRGERSPAGGRGYTGGKMSNAGGVWYKKLGKRPKEEKSQKNLQKGVAKWPGVWYYTWAPSAEAKEWLPKPQREAFEKNQ